MHFLHIVQLYYPVATGAGRYFAEVGERLAREGHRVTVLATDAYDLEHPEPGAPPRRSAGGGPRRRADRAAAGAASPRPADCLPCAG